MFFIFFTNTAIKSRYHHPHTNSTYHEPDTKHKIILIQCWLHHILKSAMILGAGCKDNCFVHQNKTVLPIVSSGSSQQAFKDSRVRGNAWLCVESNIHLPTMETQWFKLPFESSSWHKATLLDIFESGLKSLAFKYTLQL